MIAIIGAGGHAKCVYECLNAAGFKVFGFFDDDSSKQGIKIINELTVIGTTDQIKNFSEIKSVFVALGDNRMRLDHYYYYEKLDISLPNAIHPKAYISEFATIGRGNFLMGASMINPGSMIGDYAIINTNATIGHDCIIENAVQIGPGVNVAGGVIVKEGAFIGIGAKIVPGITIGKWATVGAGSVILTDIPDNSLFFGVPGKMVFPK